MMMFGAIFEVNSSIDKLWDLLEHFVNKDVVNFNKYHFFVQQFFNIVHCMLQLHNFSQTMLHFSSQVMS